MKFHPDVQERKLLAGLAAAICLSAGFVLIAWRAPTNLHTAYDTYSWSVVALALSFMGTRVLEKVGLSKNGFVPTPQGAEPVAKPQAIKPPLPTPPLPKEGEKA